MKYFLLLVSLLITITQVISQSTLPLICLSGFGLYTTYYNALELNEPYVAQDVVLPFKELNGNPSNINQNSTKWSVSYSGIYRPKSTGFYSILVNSDDGGRISIDGSRVVGDYTIHFYNLYNSTSLILNANEPYIFNLEHFQFAGNAGLQVLTSFNTLGAEPIPLTDFEPCIIDPPPIDNWNCSNSPNGLIGYYYASNSFQNLTFIRLDAFNNFFFNYAFGSPDPKLSPDDFSIRFLGSLSVNITGLYRLMFLTEEYIRVKISNIVVLENGLDDEKRFKVTPVMNLIADQFYFLEIEYSETFGKSSLFFYMSRLGLDGETKIVPLSSLKACFNPAIISPNRVSITFQPYVYVPVYLRTKPSHSVLVHVITSNSSYADPCTLVFTPNNWNVTQFVRVRSTSPLENITFTSESQDLNYNTSLTDSVTYIIGDSIDCGERPPVNPGPTCSAWGDPHFITFDGIYYDYFGIGDSYLVRTIQSDFIIQTRQGPCGATGGISCNYAAAIKYKEAVFRFFISSTTGFPAFSYNPEANFLGSNFSLSQDYDDFDLRFPNGIHVSISGQYWGKRNIYYLNVYVTLTTDYKFKAFGLCGSYDGDETNEFHDNLGKPTSLALFPNFWVVPPSEDLFEDFYAIIPPLGFANNSVNSTQNLTDLCTFSQCTFILPPPDNGTISVPNNTNITTCPLNLTYVETLCSQIFNDSDYAKACIVAGVDIEPFYRTCVFEVFNMCDTDTLKPLTCSFQLACVNSTAPQCDCLCNLEGKCVANDVCECENGWVGKNCNGNPVTQPCSNTSTPSFGQEGDYVVIFVYNLRLNKKLTCLFGNVSTTDAIYIDKNLVRCRIPQISNTNGTVQVIVQENGVGTNCGALIDFIAPPPTQPPTCPPTEPPTCPPPTEPPTCPPPTEPPTCPPTEPPTCPPPTEPPTQPPTCPPTQPPTQPPTCPPPTTPPTCPPPTTPPCPTHGGPSQCPTECPIPKPECAHYPFGHFSTLFNAVILGYFTSNGCEVEGRLAVKDDMIVSDYKVGEKITPAYSCNQMSDYDYKYSLIVGSKLLWTTSGKVYYGGINYGSIHSFISNNVIWELDEGCLATQLSHTSDFIEADWYLKSLSHDLKNMKSTGYVSWLWDGIYLTSSGHPYYEIFEIDGTKLLNAHTIAWSGGKIASTATIIFNVSGKSCGMNGLSMFTLSLFRNRILWNFYECELLTLSDVMVEGTVLAPWADALYPQGLLNGQLFVKSWDGSMDLHWYPFAGCLPTQHPPNNPCGC